MRPAAALIVCFLVAGCFRLPKQPRAITDRDPSIKIPAIKMRAAAHDRSAVAQLVSDLDNDDPAVRFYAIRALHDITGQTFDYRYYDDELERKDAVQKWQQWLAHEQGKPTTAATTRSGV